MSHHPNREFPKFNSRIASAASEGCAESRRLLSRRSMLGISMGLFSSAFMPKFARADTDPEARLLVVILRGGMDGIGMLVPKLDPFYEAVRQQLAIPFDGTLSLGSDFGLHPALQRMHAMFSAGEAAFVPAAGIPVRNRSHFQCQDNLENGLPGNEANATGWLNRFLGSLPAGDPIRIRRGIEIGEVPLIMRGPEPVLGWSPTWFQKSDPGNIARLKAVYSSLDPALWDSLSRGLEADAAAFSAGANGGDVSVLRKGFIGAARLMRAATGPRLSVLSVGGWDMHTDEGTLSGQLNDRLTELDEALGDFKTELGEVWANTVAICVTEFGRTVHANGNSGTDHGIGTVSLLVGGAVQGGFVGDWPGLAPAQLYDQDLRPTVDLRSVFKGILLNHIGVPLDVLNATVFPESADVAPAIIAAGGQRLTARLTATFNQSPSLQEVAPIARYRQRYGARAFARQGPTSALGSKN